MKASYPHLAAEGFQSLLAQLGPDPQQAGLRYERLRERLILYFLRHLLDSPEDLADLAIDRLARRLMEGEQVASLEGYALGIARFILKEQAALQMRKTQSNEYLLQNVLDRNLTQDKEAYLRDQQLDAMERCLSTLPSEEVELLNTYYLVEQKQRIRVRRTLAENLSLTPAALRRRIFGICRGLRACIQARASAQEPSL